MREAPFSGRGNFKETVLTYKKADKTVNVLDGKKNKNKSSERTELTSPDGNQLFPLSLNFIR